jgi:hypothetical protein
MLLNKGQYEVLHCLLLLANIELRNRGIMVRNLLSLCHPGVDVNMLVLCLWLESLADEHVIKLLTVHIEEISISLELRNVCSLVEISQIGDLFEVLDRLDKGKLVEVTGDNDLCVLILSEDVCNKFLRDFSLVCSKSRLESLTEVNCICSWRSSTPPFTGGRASPSIEEEPPLLPK